MDTSALDGVELNPRLKGRLIDEQLISLIVEKLQSKFPALERSKYDVELVIYLCNIIENIISDNGIKTKDKPDYKLNLALSIFTRLNFGKPEDKQFLIDTVHSIHNLGLIKKIPFFKKVKSSIIRWIKNKLA